MLACGLAYRTPMPVQPMKAAGAIEGEQHAGAFGDLGTLVPFIVAYLAVLRMDPFVPMCHGAGGMAGHIQFGARTGGALVILGAVLLVLAIFFSGSVGTLLRLFPIPILGVILFLTGAQLALGSCDISEDKGERFVTVITAALAIWNVGIAFVVGMTAYGLNKRGWLRI
jgi:hypothetical protein